MTIRHRIWTIALLGWVVGCGSRAGGFDLQPSGGIVGLDVILVPDSGGVFGGEISGDSLGDPSGFEIDTCAPSLHVVSSVDVGWVEKGKIVEIPLVLENHGDCDLVVEGFSLEGSPDFSVEIAGTEYRTPTTVIMHPFLVIPGNYLDSWMVRFSRQSCESSEARLTVFSNDPRSPGGRVVNLVGESTSCMKVSPAVVEFGTVEPGEQVSMELVLRSCGPTCLEIKYVGWKDGSSPDFALDCSSLPGAACPSGGDHFVVLCNDAEARINVLFSPDESKPLDPFSGQVVMDEGAIVIESNSCEPVAEVAVTGFARPLSECPIPVIAIPEGEAVPPQTVLHLQGDQSKPWSGSITSYHWTVKQPPSNQFNLVPSATYPNPVHVVNVVGDYEYCLDVCDAAMCSANPGCKTTRCKKVSVLPNSGIYCELTWKTPGDPNEYDEGPEAGSDLDLHFVHPNAGGPDIDHDGMPDGWFDLSYDCFWYTCGDSLLEWGSPNPSISDNPQMVRDDTDGAGPETISLEVPEVHRTYRVGVHYWDDHGFGPAFPRVRCFCGGKEAFNKDLYADGIPLSPCDMWEVAKIIWLPEDTCNVQPVLHGGAPKITNHYMNPTFVFESSPCE